jgi:hypothetical protein
MFRTGFRRDQKLKTTDCTDGSCLVLFQTTEHVTEFHHPGCVPLRNSEGGGLPQTRSLAKSVCFRFNIILIWAIALRAPASPVRNVGLG